MSRIGRLPIAIPSSVKVRQEGALLWVEGPKGTLSTAVPSTLNARLTDHRVTIERTQEEKSVKALHGLTRALVANMVQGVTEGYVKELEVLGVGYRAQVQGAQLLLTVGLSHQVRVDIPEGLSIETPKPTTVVVKGIDKQRVGQLAADIRRIAPPEPYKGKGIRYAGEVIRRKAGKAATGAKTAKAG